LHQEGRSRRISGARHGGDLAHRGGGLSRLRRHRRQGQRLLQGIESGLTPREGMMRSGRSSPRENVSRRALIAAAAAGPVVAFAGAATAQRPPPPPREKGPLVWLDLDQQDLDDAYDQRVYAPNAEYVLKRLSRNSELARERLGAPRRFAYGPTAMEGLDVFAARVPNAPVNVFVHGGAWRAGEAKNYHFPAEMIVNAGA